MIGNYVQRVSSALKCVPGICLEGNEKSICQTLNEHVMKAYDKMEV